MTPAGLLTVKDVASFLRVSESTVKSLARGGRLRAFRIGKLYRFDREAVEDYLAAIETAATAPQAAHREPVMIASPLDVSASANGYVPVDFEAIRAKEAAR